ncbi:transposase [Catenuloplanes indicus]|uniref:Transposase n=1 Tax=Catenuloplanes indicus TaxID=137267 RepID=A0AAE3VWH6_9ACTN|nr:transposase [Catenuloplanes indicus]
MPFGERMARRTFHVIDITEILAHWYAGRSQYDVAGSLGVDRKTIRRYVEAAVAAGFVPGGTPPMSQEDWAPLVRQWFPHLTDTRLRQVTWPEFAKHHDYIVEMLRAGVTKATIHQRLRDEHGVAGSLASFKRYVTANLAEDAARDKVTVLRADPEPGLEGQIDYGLLGSWMDPRTGRSQRVWAFVMVLSHSRHMFVRPVISMDQASWTASHVEAFAFFGGSPARLIPDNLKTGVDKPDLYDPKLNRAYAELAAHYGVLVDPARARKPKDKPRVERQMPYIRDSWWKGREFTSLVEMQASALHWCREVAGQRKHRGLDGRTPIQVFDQAEAGTLTPLPVAAFTLAEWSRAKVGSDVHVKCGKALYSVPWRLIGQLVDIRATATMVQVFHHGELVKTHVRTDRGRATDVADYPPEKIAFHTRTPQWCRDRAEQTGPATAAVVAELLDGPALHRLRSAQAILNLAGKYSDDRLEAACRKAATADDPSYRTIRNILAAGLEDIEADRPTGDGGAPAFLHGPAGLFADIIPFPVPTPAAATSADTTSGPKPARQADAPHDAAS